MPIYRCANCGNEAEHPTPKCVPCELDPKTLPRAAQMFTELVTLHFEPPHGKVVGWGVGHAACDPAIKFGGGVHRFTSERTAVNCQRCKDSPAFAAAASVAAMPREIVIGKLEKSAAG